MNPPLSKPNLKPRLGLFILSMLAFAVWFAFLAWVYVSQILLKHS